MATATDKTEKNIAAFLEYVIEHLQVMHERGHDTVPLSRLGLLRPVKLARASSWWPRRAKLGEFLSGFLDFDVVGGEGGGNVRLSDGWGWGSAREIGKAKGRVLAAAAEPGGEAGGKADVVVKGEEGRVMRAASVPSSEGRGGKGAGPIHGRAGSAPPRERAGATNGAEGRKVKEVVTILETAIASAGGTRGASASVGSIAVEPAAAGPNPAAPRAPVPVMLAKAPLARPTPAPSPPALASPPVPTSSTSLASPPGPAALLTNEKLLPSSSCSSTTLFATTSTTRIHLTPTATFTLLATGGLSTGKTTTLLATLTAATRSPPAPHAALVLHRAHPASPAAALAKTIFASPAAIRDRTRAYAGSGAVVRPLLFAWGDVTVEMLVAILGAAGDGDELAEAGITTTYAHGAAVRGLLRAMMRGPATALPPFAEFKRAVEDIDMPLVATAHLASRMELLESFLLPTPGPSPALATGKYYQRQQRHPLTPTQFTPGSTTICDLTDPTLSTAEARAIAVAVVALFRRAASPRTLLVADADALNLLPTRDRDPRMSVAIAATRAHAVPRVLRDAVTLWVAHAPAILGPDAEGKKLGRGGEADVDGKRALGVGEAAVACGAWGGGEGEGETEGDEKGGRGVRVVKVWNSAGGW
ncbi:hypothetical protein BDK51DRAFT_27985 [Blyttiomyces helicus]|uniref:Uncharacterized protein n=1 Tax=Blyttiomyces helicus TaxID=388810 RepID=A0A4P9WAB5_9FUNG|nr:hypothetical protein BDK51DRAFT_27985 [Blyttiomyces helicus]|eukprot:RKO88088.1 hypothetical protein BDK51DRAFT_27985 [Blyttiomyces helicus]